MRQLRPTAFAHPFLLRTRRQPRLPAWCRLTGVRCRRREMSRCGRRSRRWRRVRRRNRRCEAEAPTVDEALQPAREGEACEALQPARGWVLRKAQVSAAQRPQALGLKAREAQRLSATGVAAMACRREQEAQQQAEHPPLAGLAERGVVWSPRARPGSTPAGAGDAGAPAPVGGAGGAGGGLVAAGAAGGLTPAGAGDAGAPAPVGGAGGAGGGLVAEGAAGGLTRAGAGDAGAPAPVGGAGGARDGLVAEGAAGGLTPAGAGDAGAPAPVGGAGGARDGLVAEGAAGVDPAGAGDAGAPAPVGGAGGARDGLVAEGAAGGLTPAEPATQARLRQLAGLAERGVAWSPRARPGV